MAPGSSQGWQYPFSFPSCCRAREPDMTTGQDLTVALGDITGYSHPAAPHYPVILPLFVEHTSFCFSFSYISLPLTCFS